MKMKNKSKLGWKRILVGKCSIHYCKYQSLFHYNRFSCWGGELIYISLSKVLLIIDCRKNWIKDMMR